MSSKYREAPQTPLITYHLRIGEQSGKPVVEREFLQWKRGSYGRPLRFLDFTRGEGTVISGEAPEENDTRVTERLTSADLLAVSTLGQLASNPRVGALRRFITGWHLSYLSADAARGIPLAGPHERLSPTGDNLPNVVQYLYEEHPARLERLLDVLAQRVPRLERVIAEPLPDGRLILQVKDGPFDRPILARFASDGTLKMLAYLALLFDPEPPQLIGIEEPENYLHPRLLYGLAEECRQAAMHAQVMVTSHSPFFVNALHSSEVRVLWRDERGYTQSRRASDMPGVPELMAQGGTLGNLWMEGYFTDGDPLAQSSARS